MLWDVGEDGGVFSGRFDHSIDEKGRVSIPARFREVLQRENHDRLYITNFPFDGQRCLALYPPSQWETMNAHLRTKPRFDPRVQQFETLVIGGAHEVPADRQGGDRGSPKVPAYPAPVRGLAFSARMERF